MLTGTFLYSLSPTDQIEEQTFHFSYLYDPMWREPGFAMSFFPVVIVVAFDALSNALVIPAPLAYITMTILGLGMFKGITLFIKS